MSLHKDTEGMKISGVCKGLANEFEVDVTLIRVGWCLFTAMCGGVGIVIYIICALIFPEEDE